MASIVLGSEIVSSQIVKISKIKDCVERIVTGEILCPKSEFSAECSTLEKERNGLGLVECNQHLKKSV